MTDPADQLPTTMRETLDLRRWGVFMGARLRQGARRVQGSFLPILQSAVAASAAYFVAAEIFNRPNPIFAPIAVWVCLGFKIDRVPRKVAELAVGASVGVFIGEAASLVMGIGWWQVGLVLVVSALVGRFLDRGDLTAIQAGVNAIVILGMSWYQAVLGGVTGRWLEAVIGGGMAFIVAAILPRDPVSRPKRYARSTLTEFAVLLEMLGEGLARGDLRTLHDVQGQKRALTQMLADWEETLATAREVVTVNPALWRFRGQVGELDRLHRLTGRTQRSAEMIIRQGTAMTEEVGQLPIVGGLVTEMSRAVHSLGGAIPHWTPPRRAREVLMGVAARSAPAEIVSADWRPTAVMSLLRGLVVDLLQLTGLSREAARDALPDTWGRPFDDRDETARALASDDAFSLLWGADSVNPDDQNPKPQP